MAECRRGRLGRADCDPTSPGIPGRDAMLNGKIGVQVTQRTFERLGYHRGDRIRLTVRSVGRDTDQWRVLGIS